MTSLVRTVIVGLVLLLGFSTSAFAQSVLQSVAVQVKPGKLDDYMDRIQKLQGVMDRVGGGATVQVWRATLAGPNTRTVLVGVAYPSLAAYAEIQAKTAADPEWQKIFEGLDDLRTLVSSSLLASLDGGGVPAAPAEDAVLQGVIVRVNPGRLDDYLGKIDALQKIQDRLGSSGTMRVWRATLAGNNTGNVAVGIVHPSLAAYAENTAKLNADEEAGKLLEGLDDMRTLISSSLFRHIGP